MRSGSVFSDVPSYQAAFVAYINGCFVPIMGYATSCGVWEIPSFTIHLVPDLRLQRLGSEDRIPVQIFTLDYWVNPEKPEFRLLIDGEIVGWQYSSYSGRRSMAFTCLQHINILEDLYFFYMTNVDDVVAAQSPEVLAQGFSQPGLLYPYALFHQGLLANNRQISAAVPTQSATAAQIENPDAGLDVASPAAPIKAPYELLYNVIRGIIGKEVPPDRRSLPMMNFFARHVRKTRFHNRFVRLPYLEDPEQIAQERGVFPIFKAARNDEALNAMQRNLASEVGNSGPVWNLLRQVFGVTFMEIAMIPNPAAVLVELNSPTGPNQDGKILRVLTTNEPIVAQGVTQVAAATRAPTAVEQRAGELTRTIRAAVLGQASLQPGVLEEAGFSSLPNREIEVDETAIREHLERRQGLRSTPPTVQPAEPPRGTAEGTDTTTPIRLAQYFVKPEFLFGIPPACNVIFPSMIKGYTYDESYKNQPTRTYVNDAVMTQLLRANGPNRHFLMHALSVGYPEEANALMEHKAGGDTEESSTRATPAMLTTGKNLLIWPVEFFAGPRTARFQIPKWLSMLRQFSNTTPGAGGTGDTPNPGASTLRPLTSTPTTLAPPVPGVQIPPTISSARRGMVYTRAESRPDFAYRWLITAEALAAGNRQHVPYTMPKYRDLTPHGTVRPRGSTESVPNYQQPISPALLALADILRSVFGNVITHFEYRSGWPRLITDLNRDSDPHIAGRAVDIMLRTVRRGSLYSMPDLEHGNPIADYLIQNCEALGIQFIVWARSQWNSSKPAGVGPGKKFSHYTNAPDSERMDHFNHLHVEITETAALGQNPLYAARGVRQSPPRPARTIYGPPNTTGLIARLPTDGNAPPITRTIEIAQPGTAQGPVPTRTVTRTISPPIANAQEQPPAQEDTFQALFELYAQYQHLKSCYLQRRAALQLEFNPFIVPGFPTMIFDSMTTRMHQVAYVQQVSHQGAASGEMSTTVQVTCSRTLPEFISDVRTDAERFAARVVAAPAEVIDEVRSQIQDPEEAEKFYRRLFYGDAPRPDNAPVAFRWYDAIGYSDGLTTIPVEIVGESVSQTVARQRAAAEARRAAASGDGTAAVSTAETSQPRPATPESSAAVSGVSSQQQQTMQSNLDPNREFSPRENIYQNAFTNLDIAMQLASRPVCSLTDYIRFWHGGRTVNELLQSGEVANPNEGFAYAEVEEQDVNAVGTTPSGQPMNVRGPSARRSAVFYGRIFKLRPGPGPGGGVEPPIDAEVGYTVGATITPSATHAAVNESYPETRADWDSVLLAYVETVMYLLRPST